jgi:hypothetical protein
MSELVSEATYASVYHAFTRLDSPRLDRPFAPNFMRGKPKVRQIMASQCIHGDIADIIDDEDCKRLSRNSCILIHVCWSQVRFDIRF